MICAPVVIETQTMSHIVESCPFTKLNGGLSQLHSADDAAIAWLTNCGSQSHTQDKEADEVKLLGVHLTITLSSADHVNHILTIGNQRLFLLSQLKNQGLTLDSLHIIYLALTPYTF